MQPVQLGPMLQINKQQNKTTPDCQLAGLCQSVAWMDFILVWEQSNR
jgi:hypothetical protein